MIKGQMIYRKYKKIINFTLFFAALFLFSSPLKSQAATYIFTPEVKECTKECKQNIKIDADATGEASNAADIEIYYNPSEIEILDSNADIPGVQIKAGKAYESNIYNEVDAGLGRIRFAGSSFIGYLSSRKTLATIEFQSKPGVTSTNFTIDFDGVGPEVTLDSNIADNNTNLDLLTGVVNGRVNFVDGDCTVKVAEPEEEEASPGEPVECPISPECPVEIGDCSPACNTVANILDDISNYGPLTTIVEEVGLSGLVSMVLASVLSAVAILSMLPNLLFVNSPGFLQSWLDALFRKDKEKVWGVVTDGETDEPIQYAICLITYRESQATASRVVTDTQGRYNLALPPGEYKIETRAREYVKDSVYFKIEEEGKRYAYDFKLYKIGSREAKDNEKSLIWAKTKEKIVYYWMKSRPYIFVVGYTVAIIAVYISPSRLNYLILAFYTVTFIIWLWLIYKKSSRSAVLIDSVTKIKIPFAQIKVFDIKKKSVVDVQTTNKHGGFDFWGNPGEYAMMAIKHGYSFPSPEYHKKSEIVNIDGESMVKKRLKKGKNDIKLAMKKVTLSREQLQKLTEPNLQ